MASNSMITARRHGSIVDFETAMENFKRMFPDLTAQQIEHALRKNDGDVESTVDELLKLVNNSSKSSSFPVGMESCSNSSMYNNNGSSTSNTIKSTSSSNQPNCDDDEKIALMLQNREFLRYLQTNPAFMRELNSDPNDYYSYGFPRRHQSVLSRCKRQYGTWTSHEPPSQITNNYMDNERTPIPDGPLVDPCEKPLTRLSKKIKSKLPSMDTNAGVPRPEDIYPHTVLVDYQTSDDSFMHRLRNMSRSHKQMFLNLAKKFNVSKKNGGLMPDAYSDQSNDFSYDIHGSSSSGSHDNSRFM